MKRTFIAGPLLALSTLLCSVNAAEKAEHPQQWTLNMKDAELRDLINEVGQITGKTMILDPQLSGKVTVQSNTAMDQKGIYSLFLTVLRSQGYAAMDQGDKVLILPVAEAKTKAYVPGKASAGAFVTEVIELHNANANEITAAVRPLVAADAYMAPSTTSNALVISDSADNVQRVRQLVMQLDVAGGREYNILELKHAWASDIAKTLNDSLSGGSGEQQNKQAIADTRSNSLILVGPASLRQQMQQLAQRLDVPNNVAENARVRRLNHSDAKKLEELLSGIGKRMESGTRNGQGQGQDNQVLVSADESQNALVLMASPAQLATFESIINELDKPRAQVLVEAAIVEVSGDINEALGVQWAGADGKWAGITNFNGAGMSIGTLLENLGSDKRPSMPDGTLIGIGSSNFGALISALSSDSNNNLLSTPSLLTLDNEEAEILVGQNVPFQTGSYTTDTAGASNPFTTVERKDVGINLKVTPHINEGNFLRLQVEQESSEIAAAPPGVSTSDLITNKRSVKSTILANDGQIIVLGGLIKDNFKLQVSKVPLLGDIPWVGTLFRSTKEVTEKTNLMVFLRPTLLRDTVNADTLSAQKYNNLRSIRLNGKKTDSHLPQDPHQMFDPNSAGDQGLIDIRQPAGKRP
ncbi:type II secretion system secretin GspD [Pseudomonas sp. TTU2014-080ASC]|uniref:type II secretion system secretin GspD n=1 Tax=Pseudomonas sp. TTU2014-080ASC TaxID=1729724 RepID=UPI0007185BA0|nr:type II secretion system secretin GspD [Pseudomonas sp. TTU2014-080ASC]KRW59399.1 type II secretion system protein GspD [Pseudomonas sp. TTU2014-080ASC]